MYKSFQELLILALKQENYAHSLKVFMENADANNFDKKPLKIKTILYILSKYKKDFTVTIGSPDGDILLEDYIKNNNIPEAIAFRRFYDIALENNQQVILNNLVTGEIKFIYD